MSMCPCWIIVVRCGMSLVIRNGLSRKLVQNRVVGVQERNNDFAPICISFWDRQIALKLVWINKVELVSTLPIATSDSLSAQSQCSQGSTLIKSGDLQGLLLTLFTILRKPGFA